MSAVRQPKNFVERVVTIARDDRIVLQRWKKHARGLALTSVLLAKSSKKPLGGALTTVVADWDALVPCGKEHVEEIRERAEKFQSKKTAAAPAAPAGKGKRKRATADVQVATTDPLEAEQHSGRRSSLQQQPKSKTAQQRKTAPETRRAEVMETVKADPVLMEQLREMLGKDEQGAAAARVAAANAEIVRGAAAALEVMKPHCKTNIGRMVYNTALGTVAGVGGHTCDPAHRCSPADRCSPAEPRDSASSLAAQAELLGVRPATYRKAHHRMHNANFSVPPQQALEEGCYLWADRKTRSDVTHPRVMDLARPYWHSVDVSRPSGDSGQKAMWRPSKKAGEEYRPRRQLMVPGDKVRAMFLAWQPYVALKAELLATDSTFTDPGRTTFLSTRRGCLVEP
ncbi:unnamed protein product [Pylaiella littoralis]